MQQRTDDNGTAGTSARREHDRRKANREAATLERHARTGRLRLALQDAPPHDRRWAHGARRLLAKRLNAAGPLDAAAVAALAAALADRFPPA